MTSKHGPIVVELDDTQPAPDPASAPLVMDDAPENTAVAAATRMVARPVNWIARLFWAAFTSLISLWLVTATMDFVTGLMARNVWLGYLAMASGVIIGAVVLMFLIREFASYRRLGTLDVLRTQVMAAKTTADAARTAAISTRLGKFYAGRPDMAWALQDLAEIDSQVIDPPERLALSERILMTPLDKQATDKIRSAARQVATATAIIPLPLADVLAALVANLRMVRQIAEVYGGRAGSLGSWRLLRAVAVHLVATGAIGVADDMVGSLIGGNAVARLSRRFGEGIVNGALTARVGIAAMELCRPMPFDAIQRPGVTALVRSALTGLFSKEK